MNNKIIDPATKDTEDLLNQRYIDEAILKLSKTKSYPIEIYLGRHMIGSYTQDYIEQMIVNTGYYSVYRTRHRSDRYDVLIVNYTYKTNPKELS